MFESLLSGEHLLRLWLAGFVVAGIAAGVITGYFQARKIQPRGFKWKIFRFEAMMAVVSLAVSGTVLGWLNRYLTGNGIMAFNDAPVEWWVIGLEYAVYFVLFDTWFYWLHRWMHKEPFYTWIHKIHHKSTSPNLLTTLSVNPLESFINGGFVPLFLTACTLVALPIHTATLALITPTNVLMGLYVHAGYEFLPRWWNRTWATKWFITTTFHDQHHKYFNYNFGGYTTVWDRICGTARRKYETDFEQIADRRNAPRQKAPSSAEALSEA